MEWFVFVSVVTAFAVTLRLEWRCVKEISYQRLSAEFDRRYKLWLTKTDNAE